MQELVLKIIIEFEDPETTQEVASLLTAEDDDQAEALVAALNDVGEARYRGKKALVGDLYEASKKNPKGYFAVRTAMARGEELHCVLEGVGDAAWLMGIGLAMLAEENGGVLQEAILKDPNTDETYDLIWNGEQARYDETSANPDEDGEEDDEEKDEDDGEGFDEEDFEDDFRDDDF